MTNLADLPIDQMWSGQALGIPAARIFSKNGSLYFATAPIIARSTLAIVNSGLLAVLTS